MKITWTIVADRAGARIFESRGPGQLSDVEQIDHPEGRRQDHETGTDRPGRSFDARGGGRHALETQESPHDRTANDFARKLATRLRATRLERRFDRLVLAAEPSFLGRLRAALDEPTRRMVAAEIPKHLMQATDADIAEQLAAAVYHAA